MHAKGGKLSGISTQRFIIESEYFESRRFCERKFQKRLANGKTISNFRYDETG